MAAGKLISGLNAKGEEITVRVTDTGELVTTGGSGGSAASRLIATEPFAGNADMTHTFTTAMDGIVVSNDSDSPMAIDVHGMIWQILANEVFVEEFESFTTVKITASGDYRGYGRLAK